MKFKIKRRVLLMGMAVAASFPAGALAQTDSKAERNGSHYSYGGHAGAATSLDDVIQEAPEMRIDDGVRGMSSRLLGKIKGMAESLSSRVETVTASDLDKAWKMELSHSEPTKLGAPDDPKVRAGKALGVALRLKF